MNAKIVFGILYLTIVCFSDINGNFVFKNCLLLGFVYIKIKGHCDNVLVINAKKTNDSNIFLKHLIETACMRIYLFCRLLSCFIYIQLFVFVNN